MHLQTQREWEQKVDYAKMNPSTRESELQEIESQLERVVWAMEEKKELIAELLGDEEEEDTPRGGDGEEGAAVRAPCTRLIASPAMSCGMRHIMLTFRVLAPPFRISREVTVQPFRSTALLGSIRLLLQSERRSRREKKFKN